MEKLKYTLILISVYLSLIGIDGLSFSLSWGDITFVGVLLLFTIDLFRGNIILNKFSILFFYYILLLIFSAILNGELLNGPLLNILRTNIEGFVFFTYIFSLISREKISKKVFFIGSFTLFIAFCANTIPQLREMWSSIGFTNYQVFESSLNLNTWGFTMFLFFFLSLVSWLNGIYKFYSLITTSIIGGIMIFSFSRNVYALTIITLGWTVFNILKMDIKKLIFPIILISALFVFVDFQQLFNLTINEGASDFWNRKSQTAQSDLIDTRFYYINILPIQQIFSDFNVFQFFFGNAISVQHSFIAHSLIVTGFVGLILFVFRFVDAFKIAKKTDRLIAKRSSKLLMIFILIFLINDFVTNSSAFLPVGSYLSYLIFGYLFADIEISKRDKIKMILKTRIVQLNKQK